jgi:hypothetical protein
LVEGSAYRFKVQDELQSLVFGSAYEFVQFATQIPLWLNVPESQLPIHKLEIFEAAVPDGHEL